MGSMRQLASMIRHVHEAQGLATTEDPAEEALTISLDEADLARLAAQAEQGADNGGGAFPQV